MTAVDHAELKRLAEVISDEEIARVHGRANFGPTMTPRDVVNEGVLKYAIGFHSGSTQLSILLAHGLITKPRPGSYDASLTKKGKRYARVLHDAGINLRSFRTQAPDSWRPTEQEVETVLRCCDAMERSVERKGLPKSEADICVATDWLRKVCAALRPQTAESGK